jgi:TRAP transporter 4TM/12TM fusion protein
MCLVILLLFPFGGRKGEKYSHKAFMLIDGLLFVGSLLSIGYFILFYPQIAERMGLTTTWDIVFSVIGIICVLEVTRRTTGYALVIISSVGLVYVFIGPYLPGFLHHQGFGLERLARMEWTSLTGVFGIIMGVMVTVIYIYILLAAFLRVSGAGDYIIDFALAITGRLKGGPALSAVVASTLFGMFSGSAVANVLGTGTFTIPLMKKTGFSPKMAGAVEAASSTGGYLMPPIMGTAAFVMAEFTGIPYLRIALVGLIPSLIYYISLFAGVYLYAAKMGAKAVDPGELPDLRKVFFGGFHVFLTFPVIVAALVMGYSPGRAGFIAIVFLIVVGLFRKATRMNIRKFLLALQDGAEKSLPIITACASIGIIVAVVELTGLAINIGWQIELLTGGHLFPCLVMVMILSIIVGMGVTPMATYVLLIVTLGSTLNSLGLPVIVTHFYIIYFATKAAITPPVAMAGYAAAGLAESNPFRTGIEAFKLGIPGFIAPFLFAYYPALLLTGTFFEAIGYFLFALLVTVPLNMANFGYFLLDINNFNRILLIAASALIGLLVISPYLLVVGVFITTYISLMQYIRLRRLKNDRIKEVMAIVEQ